MDFRALKAELRAEALARRDATDPVWRIEASLAIADHVRQIAVAPAIITSGFWPIRTEVDIRPAMADFQQRGARLCLPVIVDRTTIIFRELVRGAPMIDTGFGTAGPDEGAAVLDPAVMLVPMAAFDARGHRIGYGAGYYDRAIARLRERGIAPRLYGVAFDCQEVKKIPDQPHDVRLDAIVTETGLRGFGPEL